MHMTPFGETGQFAHRWARLAGAINNAQPDQIPWAVLADAWAVLASDRVMFTGTAHSRATRLHLECGSAAPTMTRRLHHRLRIGTRRNMRGGRSRSTAAGFDQR